MKNKKFWVWKNQTETHPDAERVLELNGTIAEDSWFDDDVTPEEMLIGSYELIAKVYSQQSVINAYYRTDPDTMDVRNE